LNTTSDFAGASIGLIPTISLSRSALPDAPVVPDTPRPLLIDLARLTVVAASRLISRPMPTLPEKPAMTQG
jgi:hypothetical protein